MCGLPSIYDLLHWPHYLRVHVLGTGMPIYKSENDKSVPVAEIAEGKEFLVQGPARLAVVLSSSSARSLYHMAVAGCYFRSQWFLTLLVHSQSAAVRPPGE